ncbi:uncharacterized protein C20orf85 homolog [Tympanuchus pallidicinctus]|uniref:uncharacterized protein C20orf85 homolog n=1 Tax=Tympanuchus pallidicinctus TaxID=109042 RepID=UPI002287126F|nr:uncharacterized protein C20orf85 homolog [Tympanuchus pallidicinctus]
MMGERTTAAHLPALLRKRRVLAALRLHNAGHLSLEERRSLWRANNGAAPRPDRAHGHALIAPQRPQRAAGREMNIAESSHTFLHFRKRYVESELETARRWSHKWGFLKTALEELTEDEKKKKPKPKIELPEHLRIRPVTPVEKYIKVDPSPPVPRTSQGFIGWRSAVPELQLERCFQIQSCKGAFSKDLRWPREPSD